MSRRDVAHFVRFDHRHFVYFPYIWLAKAGLTKIFQPPLLTSIYREQIWNARAKCNSTQIWTPRTLVIDTPIPSKTEKS